MTIFRCSGMALGLLAGCAAVQPGESGPPSATQSRAVAEATAVATEFCAAVKGFREDEAERLMTAGLRASIAELRRFDADWQARNPGEKPPLGNGLRLTSWPDSPQSCTPEQVTGRGAVLLYKPAGSEDGVWRDQLVLARGPDGRLRVADIVYTPEAGGRFTQWLRAGLKAGG